MAGPSLLLRKRLLILLVIFTVIVVSLLGRIAYIQIVQGEELQKMAYRQQNLGRTLSPKRGTIYDRNGEKLAVSASADTIVVNPNEMKKSTQTPVEISQKLAELLSMNQEDVYKKITKESTYETIKKKVDRDIGDSVRKWITEEKVKGVYVDEDSKRYYPERNLAAQVIGFTGDDNQGLSGIEEVMEKYLKGVPGKILSEVDAKRTEMPFSTEQRIEAQDGLNVVLTIDETIQYFAQKEIERAIEDNKVTKGAVAIVIDPRNGDILALVSKPDFDLNDPFAAPPEVDSSTWKGKSSKDDVEYLRKTVWRNKAIMDTYEPGSTFKVVTSAAGLEEGVVTPDTMTNDSPVTIGGWTFNCWRKGSGPLHGEETFAEGVYNSCNPVFVKVAQELGITKFYNYVKAFGFYNKTGIELPGEQVGFIHTKPSEVDMASASFGQRFTITPIQLMEAYTAVANDGKLMKLRLVKELTDSQGNIVQKFEPEIVRTVISQKTSETLMSILEGVVSKGTGANAYVKGYRVAGKTGTADQKDGNVKYVASFAAIAPADNPVICVLVALFDPTGDSHMGGTIAAPVAGRLVEETLDYLGVERQYSEKDMETMQKEVYVPEVRNGSVSDAIKKLNERGLDYKVEGDADNREAKVVEQTPKPDANIPEKSVVILYTYKPEDDLKVKVPDVLNKTISEATSAFNNVGLNIKISGRGVAWKQSETPGTEVPKGEVIDVEFMELDNVD